MRKRVFATIVILVLFSTPPAHAWWWSKGAKELAHPAKNKETAAAKSPGLTLSDCYKLALKRSETIAINAELINEANAHFIQALGVMLPHLSFSSTDFKQDNPESSASSSSSSSSVRSRSSERKFTVSQTLFNGFKEYAGILGSGSERGMRKDELARAEDLLMGDVANAFYLYIQQKDDLKSLVNVENALKSRVKELRERERLGRSRQSEVVNALAQLYNVQAEIIAAQSSEIVTRQLLEFFIGRPVDDLADSSEEPPAINEMSFYLSQVNARPDVLAARKAWDVSKRQATIAGSGYFPNVKLEGNDYIERTGTNKNIDWDISLKVSVPVFEGTETLGQVQAAEAQARQARLRYSLAKRSAVQDIQDTYAKYKAAVSRTRALKKALDAAELNYHLQKKDYRLNLVNNLDVLHAIQALENAKRSYIQTLYDKKRQYWQMRVAAGEAAPRDSR